MFTVRKQHFGKFDRERQYNQLGLDYTGGCEIMIWEDDIIQEVTEQSDSHSHTLNASKASNSKYHVNTSKFTFYKDLDDSVK